MTPLSTDWPQMLLLQLLAIFIASSQGHPFLATPPENISVICEINLPIGAWLKNNTGPCAVVKGHFILNKPANKYTREIFDTFSNLKRIEGCIYAREYTGSRNLSFFSNLEEVICSKKHAKLFGLSNVIDVVGSGLKTMGFNSLTTVEGPGQIVLSYEEEQEAYFLQTPQDGEQCFFKKEQVFLAYHPQFRRTMYQTCEVDDPCFRLDYSKHWYTALDIPKNCTVFVGMICLQGPFDSSVVANRFQNLTLLIGQLNVMGTLLERIDTIFPKLENVYPFERPNLDENAYKSCSELTNTNIRDATQFVHVHLNRFLTDMSLPSLQPIRPIDISRDPESSFRVAYRMIIAVEEVSFLPDTITDRCPFFPNFTCGNFIYQESVEIDLENKEWIGETWVISMLAVAIGVAFSIRSMILLQYSYASRGLPYTRSLIIVVIFISTLVALESCIFYQFVAQLSWGKAHLGYIVNFQKSYTAFSGSRQDYCQFAEFKSKHFIYVPIQWAMSLLVAAKHACLAIIILCYIDIIIFYRTGSYSTSSKYCGLVLIVALFLSISLNSQLFVTIRGRRPNYSKDRDVVFIPFIMNAEYAENFTKYVPPELYVKYYDGILRLASGSVLDEINFELDKVPLENFGQSLSSYSNICDVLMVSVVIIFYLLTQRHVIIPRHSFTILIALYLQLSVNRIRHYVYNQILIKDFCLRKDYKEDAWIQYTFTCWDQFYYQDTLKWDPIYGFLTIRDVAFMDKVQWEILEKILEKLPYFSYPIVSFYCYVFAKYHHYFGAVVYYRETKKQTMGNGAPVAPSSYRTDKTKN